MTWLLVLALALFVVWAFLFDVDQTVRAQGQLVPTTRTQIIQAADGGVLEKILVSEGDHVKAGQLLAILESERTAAGVDEGKAKVASLSIALARARAEATGRALNFPKEFQSYNDLIDEQKQLYMQKRLGLDAEINSLQKALVLAQDELLVNERLFSTGDTSQLDLMRAQRQAVELQSKIESVRNKYLQDARQEAARMQDELASQRFKLDERQSLLQHTRLTTPVAGIVKSLRVNTVGGVLRAGDELMQISPTEVALQAEIKLMPSDIGSLYPGLPASVKIDAFDYSIYGSLTGSLEYISSDTLTEQGPAGQTQVFYRARIALDPANTNPKLAFDQLKPGMTVSVDVRTGQRSVMTYLFKPVVKAFSGAARER
jgi:adhesin transport system membrane fusion protein